MEINLHNVTIDGIIFFNQARKIDLKEYGSIRKIGTGICDDGTTGCLLDDPHFKKLYELIAIDLSKQLKLDDNL